MHLIHRQYNMKRFLSIFILIGLAFSVTATTYERLTARMNDHFDHAEWNEVLQETEKMVQTQPSDADPYSAALIAAQFLDDINTENSYLTLSQRNRIHIDSLLQHVYTRTRQLHNAQVYESLLLNLKANHKGLARVFNIYLIDFYSFARKTHETIAIADELLKATPNNNRFKKLKADALFYQGDTEEAVSLYNSIIQSDTTNYDVITILAAYYTAQADKYIEQLDHNYTTDSIPNDSLYTAQKQIIIDTHVTTALDMLNRACNIRTSIFLEKEIARMKSVTCQPPLHPSARSNSILNILNVVKKN